MHTAPECFSCFLKQALIAARLAKASEKKQTEVQKAVLRLLLRVDWTQNPPHIATDVFKTAYRTLGCADPYLSVKQEYNEKVRKLFPALKHALKNARDPFTLAVKFALAGNIIDFGILESFDLHGTLRSTLRMRLPQMKMRRLRQRVRSARRILYIADNAGEIGFDSFLIREFRKMNPSAELTLVLKKRPVINDATREDALFFGLDAFAAFADAGSGWVGTHPRLSPPSFRKLFSAADLIVSKGQANWESLEELHDPRIIFLLKAKCPIVAGNLSVPLNTAVLSLPDKTP